MWGEQPELSTQRRLFLYIGFVWGEHLECWYFRCSPHKKTMTFVFYISSEQLTNISCLLIFITKVDFVNHFKDFQRFKFCFRPTLFVFSIKCVLGRGAVGVQLDVSHISSLWYMFMYVQWFFLSVCYKTSIVIVLLKVNHKFHRWQHVNWGFYPF